MAQRRSNRGHSTENSPNRRQRNILAAAASGVADFIATHGTDPERILAESGVDGRDLGNPHVALDLGDYVGMFEHAAKITGNDNFGLDFGQRYRPEMLGLIGEIAIAAPTLGNALTQLAELFPFHQQATETRLIRDGDLLRLEYRILDGSILERRQDAELTMGMFGNVFRHCLGQAWHPEGIEFEHPRPQAWRAHESAFDAPIAFGQWTNAVVFRDRDLDRRMPRGDMARLDRLRRELKDVAGGVGAPTLLDRVRGEIRSRLVEGPPRIETVAESLAIPRWTLQRRLQDLDVTFSDVVETVRRDLSRLYLRQPHMPVTDVALLLGYSELSAFTRAFTRWYGIPPSSAPTA